MKLNRNGCFVRISVSCREVLTNTADVQPRPRVENEPETGVTSSLEGTSHSFCSKANYLRTQSRQVFSEIYRYMINTLLIVSLSAVTNS